MARKVIACKPAPEIELEFNGGERILLRLDVQALMEIQGIDGGIDNIIGKSVPEMCAAIIFGAGVNNNDNFTYERAREITCQLSYETISEIYTEFVEAMTTGYKEGREEIAKKAMAQYLNKIMR